MGCLYDPHDQKAESVVGDDHPSTVIDQKFINVVHYTTSNSI